MRLQRKNVMSAMGMKRIISPIFVKWISQDSQRENKIMLRYNIFTSCKNCSALFISKSRTKEYVYCERCRGQLTTKIRNEKRKKYFEMRKKQGYSKWTTPTWNGNAECVRKFSQNVAEQTGDCFATHARWLDIHSRV